MSIPLTLTASIAAGFTVFIFLMYRHYSNEQRRLRKEVLRARCLVGIVDILNSTGTGLREKMRLAGRRLAEEGDRDGWRCRIIVQNDPTMLPPKSAALGFQVPLNTGEKELGALIINTPNKKLDPIDIQFFDVLSRSLALSVDKETQLEDHHIGSTRRQAVRLLQGTVEHSVDNKL